MPPVSSYNDEAVMAMYCQATIARPEPLTDATRPAPSSISVPYATGHNNKMPLSMRKTQARVNTASSFKPPDDALKNILHGTGPFSPQMGEIGHKGKAGGCYRPEPVTTAPYACGHTFTAKHPEKSRPGGKAVMVSHKVTTVQPEATDYRSSLAEGQGNRRIRSDLHTDGYAGFEEFDFLERPGRMPSDRPF